MNTPETIVIGSEFFLSLYPILIKLVKTTIPTQLFSRFLTFTGSAAVAATPADFAAVFGSVTALKRTALAGLLTLAHTYTSYAAFASLSAGVSMALFFTYPLWNLLGAKFIFGEAIGTGTIPYVLSGILGTFILSSKGVSDEIGGLVKAPLTAPIGVIAALGAAITESAMYFVVKDRDTEKPWQSLLELYGGAAALFLIAWPIFGLPIKFEWKSWLPMIIFNVAVGFVGYAMRAYAIPRVKTEVFSLLSFVGVLSAFLFGYMFAGERPSAWSILGAALVVVAITHIEALGGHAVPRPPLLNSGEQYDSTGNK